MILRSLELGTNPSVGRPRPQPVRYGSSQLRWRKCLARYLECKGFLDAPGVATVTDSSIPGPTNTHRFYPHRRHEPIPWSRAATSPSLIQPTYLACPHDPIPAQPGIPSRVAPTLRLHYRNPERDPARRISAGGTSRRPSGSHSRAVGVQQ